MIGNDIIDLDLAAKESNWKRKGFLEKIFTISEQLLISKAQNPELMVWSLWSRKEAAYKIFNRQTKIHAYNPLQFECSEMKFREDHYFGKIMQGEYIYFSKTRIIDRCLHTIAVVREKDFEKISDFTDFQNVQKENGIPFIMVDSVVKPISKSHHGRFQKAITI